MDKIAEGAAESLADYSAYNAGNWVDKRDADLGQKKYDDMAEMLKKLTLVNGKLSRGREVRSIYFKLIDDYEYHLSQAAAMLKNSLAEFEGIN